MHDTENSSYDINYWYDNQFLEQLGALISKTEEVQSLSVVTLS